MFKVRGWRVEGHPVPEGRRCVFVAVPHTSNWDFIVFMGIANGVGMTPAFMGKHTLFKWPMGGFMREMGGVPVDRSAPGGIAGQMVEEFGKREEFMLVIAPEGTRSTTSRWKTGFYRIAMEAGVPLVCGFSDNARKVAGLGPAVMPTGDYHADMAKLFAFLDEETAIDAKAMIAAATAGQERMQG
ncbi:acyltransferase [Alteraurantiacibacter aquimixticola]|uniref:Acyltransferase n=1 Tax=Alteraurantiacibacter aquimixticola TaxID=2489173 RepID=A0A4T3EYW1_9SPHN|nr:acyltransferase [Alteraurantiacibacter aquimixticola]